MVNCWKPLKLQIPNGDNFEDDTMGNQQLYLLVLCLHSVAFILYLYRGDIVKQINEIKGFENIKDGYFINKEGVVFSYRNMHGGLNDKPKILKQYKKTGGYLNVALVKKDCKVRYIRVNRLVAMAFIPNHLNKPYVNHIDEVRHNNNVNNLEWVTPKENNHHSLIKKVYSYDLEGNLVKIYKYASGCINDGFNQGHVCSCARGEEKTHKKHIFSYKPLTKEDIVQRLSKPYSRKKANRRE